MTVWFSLTLKFSAIALAAFVIGVWQGAVAGWAALCGGLALLHAAHVYHLARMERWLRAPNADDLPDPWGAWGVVFAAVYRALRREAKEREGVVKDLDLFMQAAQALPDGIAMLDSGDQLLWCNDTAAGHLGLQAGRDYGLRITNIVRVPRLAAFLQSKQPDETLDYRPVHNPGQLLSLKAIPFSDGRKLLVSFDITQIERADTTRRDFIANVSHELRTPLTVIHGFLEHMSEAPVMPAEQARRHIGLMVQQSDRMLKLVDDLLMLSRLEGGDSPQREERVDVYALLQTLAEDALALSAGRHQIEVVVAEGSAITGGADELRSAFGNLVSNAVRYTPRGGRITLSWRLDLQGGGIFSVLDSGIGIAAEHIPRLTERFYRVDRGRSRETGGTGLGLAIVKHVLLRHQATLEIHSELGVGSEFRIVFPPWRSIVEIPRAEADAA
ncbi:MAG TPA: phosphate regulon sensor histidine kinase PhoR [Burkholderiales bacterium]|nr:phosphate regulon sensor histidine kinase PhoR [Burkholderiales bacterium]